VGLDNRCNGQLKASGEFVVPLVMRGYRHNRTCAVVHQHIICYEHREIRLGKGVYEKNVFHLHACLFRLGLTFAIGLALRVINIVFHFVGVGAVCQ